MSPSEHLPRILFNGCPLCGFSGIKQIGVAGCAGHKLYNPIIAPTINWMQCPECSHVFTDGYFSDEQNEVLFSTVHPNQVPGYNIEAGRTTAARIIERVARFEAPGSWRWLDIGFGDGSLLMTAKEYGYRPFGIDAKPRVVDEMRKFGIAAEVATLDQFEFPEPHDIVSMADVLEHMPFPGDALSKVHDLLSPGGVLFVSCPNSETAAWQHLTANNANPYWGEIEHFHNFSRSRLASLLQEHGFEPVNYSVSHRYRMGMEIVARKKG